MPFQAQTSRVFGNRDLATDARPREPGRHTYAAVQNDIVKSSGPETDEDIPPPSPVRNNGHKMYTVVVDAGHGGQDPGAQAFGLKEKNITLSIALALRRQLEETGNYKVVMTRDTD